MVVTILSLLRNLPSHAVISSAAREPARNRPTWAVALSLNFLLRSWTSITDKLFPVSA